MSVAEIKEIPEELDLQVHSKLSDDLRDKVEKFRASVTDMDGQIRTPEEEEGRSEKYCSDDDLKRWILVLKGNDLIGMTAVFGRQIPYDNQIVSMGGIGKVRVREDWRNKGVASRMLDEAMGQLSEMKYNVAFLTTNTESFLADFYRKYGFAVLSKGYKYSGLSGKQYEENDGMLAPIDLKDVSQQIINDARPLDIGKGKW